MVQWLHIEGLRHVIEVGADSGTFLTRMLASAPGISGTGVDLRPVIDDRFRFLCQRWDPKAEGWRSAPESEKFPIFLESLQQPVLLIAVEWLDDLWAPVVHRSEGDTHPAYLNERGVLSPADRVWLDRWWPQGGTAVIGRTRDRAWAWLAERLPRTSILATIDYGHTLATRPVDGGLTAHRHGQVVPPGESANTTASVAVDAVATAAESAGGRRLWLSRLRDLPVDFWLADDARPLQRAALRSQEQLLRDPARFGDFWLIAHRV